MKVDWKRKSLSSYNVHRLQYLIFGVPLSKSYCWGQEVYAPFDGIIVSAKDGYNERSRAYLLSDLYNSIKNTYFFNSRKDNIQSIAGNYIIYVLTKSMILTYLKL